MCKHGHTYAEHTLHPSRGNIDTEMGTNSQYAVTFITKYRSCLWLMVSQIRKLLKNSRNQIQKHWWATFPLLYNFITHHVTIFHQRLISSLQILKTRYFSSSVIIKVVTNSGKARQSLLKSSCTASFFMAPKKEKEKVVYLGMAHVGMKCPRGRRGRGWQ